MFSSFLDGVQRSNVFNQMFSSIIFLVIHVLKNNRLVSLEHTYREANRVAHELAAMARDNPRRNCTFLHQPPQECRDRFQLDLLLSGLALEA
ncbi:hypothetical protein G2W53_000794 [Senna tora]|uniref:RNase H type-1 domain-containing protein n=1 Tax=Senna tora TaxID=362788 RepID=A0A834XGE9_9FABA|nr:hypothetical protein G2W53_000794 [Senna tora]